MIRAWIRQQGHCLRHSYGILLDLILRRPVRPGHCAISIQRNYFCDLRTEHIQAKKFLLEPNTDYLGCTCGKVFWQRPSTEADNAACEHVQRWHAKFREKESKP